MGQIPGCHGHGQCLIPPPPPPPRLINSKIKLNLPAAATSTSVVFNNYHNCSRELTEVTHNCQYIAFSLSSYFLLTEDFCFNISNKLFEMFVLDILNVQINVDHGIKYFTNVMYEFEPRIVFRSCAHG